MATSPLARLARLASVLNTIPTTTTPRAVDPAELAAAQTCFAALPSDHVPERDALPPLRRFERCPNDLFTGLQEDLLPLAQALKQQQATAISQVASVSGLGGVGKSVLAVEFAYRDGRHFAGEVFWLSFGQAANVPFEVAACGQALFASETNFTALPLAEQVRQTYAAWKSPLPRLLIFDNLEDESLFSPWRPVGDGCHILITSRRDRWNRKRGIAQVRLDKLPRARSIALLAKYSTDLDPVATELDAIAAELGDLPLALKLAGA